LLKNIKNAEYWFYIQHFLNTNKIIFLLLSFLKIFPNNKKKIKYYEQNKWEKITTTKANKNLTFNLIEEELEFQKYDEVYHVGGEVSGYYYLLEKQENGYYLYRTPSQNKKMITYISTVNDTKNIYLLDDYVYFLDGQFIKYYHDTTGVRTLLEYRELEFNKNIIFGVAKN